MVEKNPVITQATNPGNNKDAVDLIKGLLFNFLGMALKLGKFLFILVAAKFYGAAALGIYFLAWSAVDIASKLGLWGMDKSLIRDIARRSSRQNAETNQQILSIIYFNVRVVLFFSMIVAAIVFWAAPLVAHFIFNDASLVAPMRILSLAIPFTVLTLVLIATTKALRLMQYEAFIRQGLEPAVLLTVTFVLIPFSLGATGLVLAHLIASFAASVAAFVVVLRKYKHLGWPPQPLSREVKIETFRYTSPIAAMDFLNLSVARTDIVLVGALMSSTAAGLYGVAIEIISVIKRVRQGLEPVFAPIVSELFHNAQQQRLQRNYVLVTRWLLAGSLLPVIAMLIFPGQILSFFDIHSRQAAAALMVLALAHGLFGTFSAAESLLVMTGKTLLNAGLGALMLTVNIALGWVLIPELGLVGAALGTLTAFFTVSGARVYYGYKQFQLWPFDVSLLWPLATAASAATVFYLLKSQLNVDTLLETVTLFMAMPVVYALTYFLGASEPEEKYLFDKLKRKFKKNRAHQNEDAL